MHSTRSKLVVVPEPFMDSNSVPLYLLEKNLKICIIPINLNF